MFDHLFIYKLQSDPKYFFAVLITVVISTVLHELAHGIVAIRLGDDTPVYSGHMTLNPLVHMGGFSLLLLAIAGISFGQMPVDRTRLRGKYAESLVAAAGPATNLLLALLAAVGLGLWARLGSADPENYAQMNGIELLNVFIIYNFALAIFNLVPVPPLDGSWIAANLYAPYRRLMSAELMQGIMSALIFAMFLGGAGIVFYAAYQMFAHLMPLIAGQQWYAFPSPTF